jgi:hypothetical protein
LSQIQFCQTQIIPGFGNAYFIVGEIGFGGILVPLSDDLPRSSKLSIRDTSFSIKPIVHLRFPTFLYIKALLKNSCNHQFDLFHGLFKSSFAIEDSTIGSNLIIGTQAFEKRHI